MIDEIALDHGFAVGVFEDRFAKYFRRLKCGGRCECDANRIKIRDDAAILALVIALILV